MINKSKVILPTDDDEIKLVLSKACDLYTKALNTSKAFFTKFLSPLEFSAIQSRFPKTELYIKFFGGYDDAERKVCAFYLYEDFISYPITALKFKPKSKNAELSHRDYLGSVLSLGIKREMIGDIVITDGSAIMFCLDEIADYIIQNLIKIGGTGVIITREDNLENINIKRDFENISSTVSSMRCDSIVSSALNLARGKADELIEKGQVTLNYEIAKTLHQMIKNGDVLSVRGYGKFRVQTDGKLTRKGRIHINLLKYK